MYDEPLRVHCILVKTGWVYCKQYFIYFAISLPIHVSIQLENAQIKVWSGPANYMGPFFEHVLAILDS